MKYSIKMVLKRIRINCFSYIILTVQLAIGIAFIAYAANHLFSAGRMMRIVEKKVMASDIRIEPEMKGTYNEADQPPVTYSEYKKINKLMSGNTELNVYREETAPVGEGSIYYVFTDSCENQLDGEAVYVNRKLYDEIKSGGVEELSDFIIIKDGRILDSWTGNTYTVNVFPEYLEDEAAFVNSLGTVMYADCILFPLKGYQDRIFNNYLLTMHVKGINNWQEKSGQVLNLLEGTHGDYYQYIQQNPRKEQQNYFDYMTVIPRYLGKLAVVMLFVLIFGFSGLLHLHVKSREKEYSVCYAMGAGSGRICMELMLEILLVCAWGMILGNLLCLFFMKVKVFDSLFPVSYFPATVVLTFVIICVLTLIITLASVIKILKLEPAKLLQSL